MIAAVRVVDDMEDSLCICVCDVKDCMMEDEEYGILYGPMLGSF